MSSTAPGTQSLRNVLAAAPLVIGETDLVMLAIDRPEVAALHLARAGPAGLDRGLVHRLDPAGADRVELGRKDGFEQRERRVGELREPRARDLDAVVPEPLVLAVQRLVVAELVGDESGHEAHVGAAALDDAGRRRRAVQRLGVAALDRRTHVLEDHVAARALREPETRLLANHLVLIRGESVDFRVRHGDRLDRHPRLVEEQRGVVARGVIGGAGPSGVGATSLPGVSGTDSGTGNSPRCI